MDFRRLLYFVAVAEELHFGRAASRLSIAQPPLSRQIAQLEKELGVDLFDRSRSQIRLTQAGEVLLDRAREILGRIDRTEREVHRIGEGIAGRLRVAFVGSATYGLLPQVIKEFRSTYPDVELALSAMNNAEIKRSLIQREIDIGVARPSLDDAEIRSEVLLHEPLILAIPEHSNLNSRPALNLTELRNETFVLFPRRPRPCFADHILEVCQHEGFIPKSTVFAQDYHTAISLVSVDLGICLVPTSVSASSRPGVVYRQYTGYNPGTALSLNYRLDNRAPHSLNFLKTARKVKARMSAQRSEVA